MKRKKLILLESIKNLKKTFLFQQNKMDIPFYLFLYGHTKSNKELNKIKNECIYTPLSILF